jgi:hypothetical protein
MNPTDNGPRLDQPPPQMVTFARELLALAKDRSEAGLVERGHVLGALLSTFRALALARPDCLDAAATLTFQLSIELRIAEANANAAASRTTH